MDKQVTGYDGPFTFWSDGSVTEEIETKSGASLFRTLPPHSVFPFPSSAQDGFQALTYGLQVTDGPDYSLGDKSDSPAPNG